MKKILLLVLTVTLNLSLFSCTPESVIDTATDVQACCDNQGPIIPPPPPPPPTDDLGN